MGVFSEINLFKPANGAFIPGSLVSGSIKYVIDEETVFDKITISLKGIGRLNLREKEHFDKEDRDYIHEEIYVDIDHMIHDQEQKPQTLPIGSYETQFNFTLPQNIPPSFEYYENTLSDVIDCKIKYYIRIKFDRPGFMKFAIRLKKEMTVSSIIFPRLSMVPTIFGEQKALTTFFTRKKSVINLKATIEKCVFKPGDKIHLNYDLFNDTNVTIKGVGTKLVELYRFMSVGIHEAKINEDVKNTDSKTGSINPGDTQNMDLEIALPSDLTSLEHSKIVTRDYFVEIIVNMPIPHRNLVLKIPVQIGFNHEESSLDCDEPPPSYWEAMEEQEKDRDNEKGEKS